LLRFLAENSAPALRGPTSPKSIPPQPPPDSLSDKQRAAPLTASPRLPVSWTRLARNASRKATLGEQSSQTLHDDGMARTECSEPNLSWEIARQRRAPSRKAPRLFDVCFPQVRLWLATPPWDWFVACPTPPHSSSKASGRAHLRKVSLERRGPALGAQQKP